MAKAMIGGGVVVLIMSYLFMATHATDNAGDCRPTPSPPAVRIARLRIYVQVNRGGECPTSYEVARASITSRSPTGFGSFTVVDLPITAGPDLNSRRLGSVQGIITSSDFERPLLFLNYVFVFTSGPYNGSYIVVTGRVWTAAVTDEENEVAVVGGGGAFRYAEGYGYRRVYALNYGVTAVEDRVSEYDFAIRL